MSSAMCCNACLSNPGRLEPLTLKLERLELGTSQLAGPAWPCLASRARGEKQLLSLPYPFKSRVLCRIDTNNVPPTSDFVVTRWCETTV